MPSTSACLITSTFEIIRYSTTLRYRRKKQPHVLVEGNVTRNTGGTVFITPGCLSVVLAIVRRNFVTNNNTPNFAIPVRWWQVSHRTGILVMSGDKAVTEDNIITGNTQAGLCNER